MIKRSVNSVEKKKTLGYYIIYLTVIKWTIKPDINELTEKN